MGYGDEIMVTGEAGRLKAADPGLKIVIGDGEREVAWIWSEVFDGNPNLSRLEDIRPGDRLHWLKNYHRCRPYLDYERIRAGERQYFKPYRAVPGEFFFSPAELDRAASEIDRVRRKGMPVVSIEPNVDFGPNKDWGFGRWQAVVHALRERVTFVQPSYGKPVLVGAHAIPSSFRSYCAVLSQCDLHVGPEGGLHHGAAAVGCPAVVIFGGRIDPQTTGYDFHENLYVDAPESPCGMVKACAHCRRCLDSISVDAVIDSVQRMIGAATGGFLPAALGG